MEIIENLQIWSASEGYEGSERIKPRPVIFVDASSYTILQFSSKTEREGYVIKDWREVGLEKPSVIRTDRRVVLKESDIKEYIGVLTERDVYGFLECLREHPPPTA
ncbi:MAG: hypothetical protein GX224_02575 [Thermoplasmatales archaeon]|nr:hypothetical protein [Thermoplasmatales archaeon]